MVEQATIHYSEETEKTRVGRVKEEASDYRYFPEPDLPPLLIDERWIREIKESLEELPEERMERYIKLGLIKEDAEIISDSTKTAELFEETLKILSEPLEISKWLIRDYRSLGEPDISAESFAKLIGMVLKGQISRNIGAEVLYTMVKTKKSPEEIVKEKNLAQISNTDVLKKVVEEVFEENSVELNRLKEGETKLIGFFVGKVMKKTGGKADPKEVSRLISKYAEKH
jgi:aspartyl-tRNA(Asn)/glutamyl-tRNA(Gln) amidotransferase subunit B